MGGMLLKDRAGHIVFAARGVATSRRTGLDSRSSQPRWRLGHS